MAAPGRTRGHHRGELVAAHGENSLALDILPGALPGHTKGLLDGCTSRPQLTSPSELPILGWAADDSGQRMASTACGDKRAGPSAAPRDGMKRVRR